MKTSFILGLNARSQLFSYPYNTQEGKRTAASKLLTKKALIKKGIPIPQIYAKFKGPRDILGFDWSTLPSSFALKPSRGFGGEGIIVVKKRIAAPASDKATAGQGWITTQRKRVTPGDLQLHTLDILEGAYSIGNVPDMAYIEEYVPRHKAFRKYAYRGTPDIRIIVFNKIPVLAMLRLPTRESGGRANLHQGAIGVGIDIATGITTYAVWHGEQISFKPGSKRKLNGIKIPNWTKILEIAVLCQEAATLGLVGVDIVLHPEKGPMVLEINSAPGLEIQLANRTGLKKRLEMVEDIKVTDTEHAVKTAKALFTSPLAARVRSDEEPFKVHVFEEVRLRGPNGKKTTVTAKLDTGAWRTSIDERLAETLGLINPDNILWTRRIKSSFGVKERPVINLTFWLKGKKIETLAGVTNRKHLKKLVLIGRRDLDGFVIQAKK